MCYVYFHDSSPLFIVSAERSLLCLCEYVECRKALQSFFISDTLFCQWGDSQQLRNCYCSVHWMLRRKCWQIYSMQINRQSIRFRTFCLCLFFFLVTLSQFYPILPFEPIWSYSNPQIQMELSWNQSPPKTNYARRTRKNNCIASHQRSTNTHKHNMR